MDRLSAALSDRYRLERELGAGGMATVYLARDVRHDRDVAIKVLRPELAAVIGAERFLAEIKTTANLQHPHILPLFDSGKIQVASDPHDSGLTTHVYYVMPFVEGESLRDRLARERQLSIADAVRIAREVASALDYAHRHGVIHRDIKPENILLHDGQALVADFGIALAAARSDGGTRMTETGMSLGTPHYMSPEQAMGERDLDARTDVYALGCVLYEMLTGEPPFSGPSAQAIVAKVMTERPTPPSATRDTVPEGVEEAVLIALSKLPVDRFASAAEFGAALAGGRATTRTTARRTAVVAPSGKWRQVSLALGAVAVVLAAVAAWALLRPPAQAGPVIYDVGLADNARMSFTGSVSRIGPYGALVRNLSVSPDGSFVVYAATRNDSTSLWYRSLLTDETRELPGTSGATGPRISPDGRQVVYFDGDSVLTIPVAGSDPRLLTVAVSSAMVGWVTPNRIVAVDEDGYRANEIDPGSGQSRTIAIARCPLGVWEPSIDRLLCSFNGIGQVSEPESGVVTTIRYARDDGAVGAPVAGSAFRIVEGRYLVWLASDGYLTAATYDAERHAAGRAVRLLSGVRREALGEGQYDISSTGSLVYAPGLDASVGSLVRYRPGGEVTRLPMEAGDFQRYDLSANGRWLAAVAQGAEHNELRIYDLRDQQRFVWQRAETIRHALWSPGGDVILFTAHDGTRWALHRGAPGSGQAIDTLATFSANNSYFDPLGYPSDSVAIVQDWLTGVVARFDPRATTPVFDTVLTGARFPSVSPNGRLIAYQTSDENRILVTAFPTSGRRWQVATLGVEPMWLSATELLYRFGAIWYVARIDPATGEPLGAATFWGRDPRFSDTSGWSNRPAHDGGVVYVQSPEQAPPTYLRVIPGWVDQMKRAVAAAGG